MGTKTPSFPAIEDPFKFESKKAISSKLKLTSLNSF